MSLPSELIIKNAIVNIHIGDTILYKGDKVVLFSYSNMFQNGTFVSVNSNKVIISNFIDERLLNRNSRCLLTEKNYNGIVERFN
jgi:hypothetical protein